eukprot:646037-Pelagomonas_calceolata.AAC.1
MEAQPRHSGTIGKHEGRSFENIHLKLMPGTSQPTAHTPRPACALFQSAFIHTNRRAQQTPVLSDYPFFAKSPAPLLNTHTLGVSGMTPAQYVGLVPNVHAFQANTLLGSAKGPAKMTCRHPALAHQA